MAPRSPNHREYGAFKRMLEQALLEIRLPAGIIDTENIVPGSIRPENCKLDATWDFRGSISAGGNQLNGGIGGGSTDDEVTEQQPNRNVAQVDSYTNPYKAPSTNEPKTTQENIVFLDALKRKISYTLPPVAKSLGQKVYVKRIDKDQTKICRVLTYQDDKLDDTDGVELGVGQAVILIASSEQWHVFSKLN